MRKCIIVVGMINVFRYSGPIDHKFFRKVRTSKHKKWHKIIFGEIDVGH